MVAIMTATRFCGIRQPTDPRIGVTSATRAAAPGIRFGDAIGRVGGPPNSPVTAAGKLPIETKHRFGAELRDRLGTCLGTMRPSDTIDFTVQ